MHTVAPLIDDRNGKLVSLCDHIQRLPFAFSFLDIPCDYRVILSPLIISSISKMKGVTTKLCGAPFQGPDTGPSSSS